MVDRRVTGLDLATATGFAIGPLGGTPRFGTFHLPQTGEDIGRYLAEYDKWLCRFIDIERPDDVFFEAPMLSQNTKTARKLMCLAGETERICFARGVRVAEVNISSAKVFFAGHGHADKPMMVIAAHEHGWTIADCWHCEGTAEREGRPCRICEGTGYDHNQADAGAIWGFGCASLRPGIIRPHAPVPGPLRKPKKVSGKKTSRKKKAARKKAAPAVAPGLFDRSI